MKRFSKIALSVAAVSALTAAMAISASAMTADYADGTVTLDQITATGASQTLLVLDTADLEVVAAENIKQIDQKDDGTSFAAVPVGNLAAGTYEVRIGGNGTIQKVTFTVGSEPEGETVQLGDVNIDTIVDSSDISPVVEHILGSTTLEGKKFFIADTNVDTIVDTSDISPIVEDILGSAKLGTAVYKAAE